MRKNVFISRRQSVQKNENNDVSICVDITDDSFSHIHLINSLNMNVIFHNFFHDQFQ